MTAARIHAEDLRAPRPWGRWLPGPVPRALEPAAVRRYGADTGYLAGVTATWQNGWFAVMVRPLETSWGPVLHVMIRNLPSTPVRSWPDLMRIKDELFGPERTAVEVFPPRDEVIDQANMTHLWVLPETMTLPFSLSERGEGR